MTLSKFAKAEYVNRVKRDFDDWSVAKELTASQVTRELRQLRPIPNFSLEPRLHQKVCFLLGMAFPEFLFFGDTGVGKTSIVLNILRQKKRQKELGRALVVVPNVANIENWEQECEKHTPDLNLVPLYGGTVERVDILNENMDGDVYVINYAGLTYLATEKNTIPTKAKKKKQRVLSVQKLRALANYFDGFALDESQNVKSIHSLAYKILNAIAGQMDYRYAMTATPFGRDPQDLWSQFNLIDRGETFGTTLGMFREIFFTTKRNYWGGYEHTFKQKQEVLLQRMIRHKSIRYMADECVDMPDKNYQTINARFPGGAEKYCKALLKEIIDTASGRTEKKSAFIKMRQISSGFIRINDKAGDVDIVFKENPKLEKLMDFLERIPEPHKIIVFNELIKSGDLVRDALNAEGIVHARLYSGTKDPRAEIAKFKTDPECRVLLANSKSGGTGLNLQVANYVIFYESPTSAIVRHQAEGRAYRQGQPHKVFFIDLVVDGTFDHKILSYQKEGKDLLECLLDGKVARQELLNLGKV